MFPDLFSIGPLTIHTYGLFVAIGFLVSLFVTIKLGKAQGIDSQQIIDMAFRIILWAIIGSRLAYIIMNLPYFLNRPLDALKLWEGGLVFSGGLILALLALIWHVWRRHLSFWTIADLWSPGLAIGQGIGRMGCFMAGCCYGKPTELPWGITFSHSKSLAPLNISLHPTQLYASLSGFILFLVLILIQRKKGFEGRIFLWFLILHSTSRLFIERFRGDFRGLIPGTEMSGTQLITLLILLFSVITLFLKTSGKEKREGRPTS